MTSSMSHGNRSRSVSSKLSLSTRFVCVRTSSSVSSLTSSSKRYCTPNVVSHDCVSMCTVPRKIIDYTVTCLEPTASTNVWYCAFILLKSLPPGDLAKSFITDQMSFLTPDVLFIQPLVSRRNNLGLPKEWIINKSWRKTIPDNRLARRDHSW